VGDWRTPLVKYLQDPKSMSDRKVQRWALKFVLDGDELYRQTADDLLLKCLGPDQARLAMAEVHEGICGTHQSAPKMKRLLRRACFYWPTMIADCFRYYKGCEECQKHGDVQLVLVAMCIQLSNLGHSEVGDWISLARYILCRLKDIAL
jgi:hypothetical protein